MVGPRDADNVINAILERHRTMLRGYLRHLLASFHDVDDVLQEMCVQVLRSPDNLKGSRDAGAYLRGMARHLVSRHCRRMKSQSLREVAEQAWEMDGRLERDDARAALAGCLRRLSARARQTLAWRYEDDLTSVQIGEQLGKSAEAVRMALARTRQFLARCLAGQGISAEEL